MATFSSSPLPSTFGNVLFDPMKVDATIAALQYNKLQQENLRSEIDERAANRTALGNLDFGGPPGGAPATPSGTTAPTGTFEQQLGGSEGGTNPAAVNKGGYSGQFQFGAARLADLGFYKPAEGENLKANEWKGTFAIPGFGATTHDDFLKSPAAQHAVFAQHVADIDKTIAATPGAAQLDQNGLRAVAHLGGNAGMQRFVESGGLYDPGDNPNAPGGGTHLSDYYRKFAQGGAPALQAAFGSPHGPGGPQQAPGVGSQAVPSPYQTASLTPTPPPRAPIVTDPTLGAVSPDVAWLDEQAKTYPDLAGPNANPTVAPINAPGAAAPVAPGAAFAPQVAPGTPPGAVAPAPAAPAAPVAPAPQATAPTVPAPTPPLPVNELYLTTQDQATLRTMATSKGATVAQIAAKEAELRSHNQALAAQYQNERQQYEQTTYARNRNTQADKLAADALARQAKLDADKAAREGVPTNYERDPDNPGGFRPQKGGPADPSNKSAKTAHETFQEHNTLRDEYAKLTEPFRLTQAAYSNVKEAAKTGTGASDMSLVYAYIKMLDPNVVHSAEVDMAAGSGGYGALVANAYNRVANGQKLTPGVRADFVTEAKHLYGNRLREHNEHATRYEELATRAGLDPKLVVQRYDRPDEDKVETAPSTPAAAGGWTVKRLP